MLNDNIKILTFDIWDTLLKRYCHPEEIKLYTCQYLFLKYRKYIDLKYNNIYDIYKLRNSIEREICEKNKKNGFDYECSIYEVFSSMRKKLFKKSIINLEKELVEIEIEHEKEVTYVNPDIIQILEKYKNYDMYCISDFYINSDGLSEILKSKNILKYFKKVYSSSDFLLTKKSGNLFKKVKDDLKAEYSEIMHFGDNIKADVEVPKELGMHTIKITNNSTYKKIFDRSIDVKKIVGFNDNKSLFEIGKKLSIIPYYFVLKILYEESIKNTNKIYYFTREGEFFIKVSNKISNQSSIYKDIKSELLEVSRMATFSPSLNDFSISSLMNLWNQYQKQSMSTLYKSLDIKIDKYVDYIGNCKIDISEEIDKPWLDDRVKKLFSNKEFVELMNKEIDNKRRNLELYFSKKEIKNDNKPITVVDIGWRGTIQDNIANIFNKKEVTGYYLSLFDFYNKQLKNTKKVSILEDTNIIKNCVGGIITLLEMLFIPNSGSVIRYESGKAIRKIMSDESKLINKYINKIQEGMLEGVDTLISYFNMHPFDITDVYKIFENSIIDLRKNPDKELVSMYFNVVLNNSFGAGNYVSKSKLNWKDKLNYKKVINAMRKESWKEAFLKYNNLYILAILFKIKNKVKKHEN